jgi:energy-coupling factor transporter ATP-binding protein EcfA2
MSMDAVTFSDNDKAKLALGFVQNTNRHLFLTGKAGTGKTTFLKQLKTISSKRMIVVAPTGVAALNAEGVTIHSFFALPLSPYIPMQEGVSNEKSLSRTKIAIIRNLDLLIIDEISMVRADLLDAIDAALRRYRRRKEPFGGVQLLMIGDLQQLPPVVTDVDKELLTTYYKTSYFFGSYALQRANFVTIELEHVYRQRDEQFIRVLNAVRENRLQSDIYQLLRSRYIPNFHSEEHVILTTHNNQAQRVNTDHLSHLSKPSHFYEAVVSGEFSESAYPTDFSLELKVGARVMFLKNDPSEAKAYYNGKIGIVTSLNKETVSVKCDGDIQPIAISPMEWNNMQYSFNEETHEVVEKTIGTFIQIPLKLAWAITIHKSQGLTFDRVVIDARAAFAHGQIYVALSRCRSLEGLILTTLFSEKSLVADQEVANFTLQCEQEQPTETMLEKAREEYIHQLLFELFDFVPIKQAISNLLHQLSEHEAIVVGMKPDDIRSMSNCFEQDVLGVNDRFLAQMKTLLPSTESIENNILLQERVRKAIPYYVDKIDTIVLFVLKTGQIETDNQTVKKTVDELVFQLREQVWTKKSCLESCAEGFAISHYVTARTNAVSLFEQVITKERSQSHITKISMPHQELYLQLRAWRNAKASDLGMEPHAILRQTSIDKICSTLPSTKKTLGAIKGVGAKRMREFGDELLEIIVEYLKMKGLMTKEDLNKKLQYKIQSPNDDESVF